MVDDDAARVLAQFFPRSFGEGATFQKTSGGALMFERFHEMADKPIHYTHFNQMLHLVHEAGVSEGFFKYYFLAMPGKHPYPLDKVIVPVPGLDEKGISSLSQLEWGIRRLFIDGLLYFADIRSCYSRLRLMSYEKLEGFFAKKRYDSEKLRTRGEPLPLIDIPVDDRYLISEIACKAYSPAAPGDPVLIERLLVDAYRKRGHRSVTLASLFDESSDMARDDPHGQMMLKFAAEEIMDHTVNSEEEIRQHVSSIAKRFSRARATAIDNTTRYLSLVNDLDVYVATSMRRRSDFRNMARDCAGIFGHNRLKRFRLRYFDPTMSAAEGHEDKGLIECLMVKCARALLYFAGESDSFGKDAEVTMAMSLGKPVLIFCPEGKTGEHRAEFFKDIHPLSRMIEFETAITSGAMVTQSLDCAAELLERLFDNKMEYGVEHTNDGYFRLKERLTGSVVRFQTGSRMLRETFANYYRSQVFGE